MTATPFFPLAVWQEGTTQNALPANENTIHIQAAFGRALDFSDAAPGSPAAFDQYVVRTTWGGFGVGNVVIFVGGAWREFSTFDGLSKIINGVRYVRMAGAWHQFVSWVDVPATASSPGVAGQIARDVDNLFFYVCTATDTWKRCALTSDVTPPPPPPAFPTPALLMDYEDVSATDRGPHALTVENHGTTVTTAQKKFGSQGLSIGGGYLRVADASLIIGTQDFTLDMWIYPTNIGGERFLIDSRDTAGATRGFGWLFHAGGYLGIYDGSQFFGSSSAGQSGAVLAANQWQHCEIGRESGTVYVFLDGVLIAQSEAAQFTNNFQSQTYNIHAGQYYPSGVESMEGYADEVRFVIGQCIHTSNFVPPTTAYPTY